MHYAFREFLQLSKGIMHNVPDGEAKIYNWNMLKAKDAADVVLMNNFLADFPVEEVSPCEASLCHYVRCYIWTGETGSDMEGRGDQIETTQRQAPV